MLTQCLGDMAEVKGWALSIGRKNLLNQSVSILYIEIYLCNINNT